MRTEWGYPVLGHVLPVSLLKSNTGYMLVGNGDFRTNLKRRPETSKPSRTMCDLKVLLSWVVILTTTWIDCPDHMSFRLLIVLVTFSIVHM